MQPTQINDEIYWLDFATQKEVAKTFIRFLEYYEGPKHRGAYFSLKAYKAWYRTQSKSGKFTYFSDWSGFNIPGHILAPFYAGHFNPLTREEKTLLDLFRGHETPFYLVGTYGGQIETLGHEICHGLFYTNAAYHEAILTILNRYDLSELRAYLLKTGYHAAVLDDECHAYAGYDAEWLRNKKGLDIPEKMTQELRDVLTDYFPEDYRQLLPWLEKQKAAS